MRALLEPAVAGLGFELWDLRLSRAGGRTVLELLIDHPDGVTLEHCRDVSARVSEVLDEADPIPDEFTLEVASPGIERTLRHRGDLERFEGCLARITTRGRVAGALDHRGRLAGVDGSDVVIRLESGETRTIPIGSIRRATLVYDPESGRAGASKQGGRGRA